MERKFGIGKEKALETRLLPSEMRRFCAHQQTVAAVHTQW